MTTGGDGKGSVTVEARFVDRLGIVGHAYQAAEPERRFVVEVLVDGLVTDVTIADRPDEDLRAAGVGDGRYAFLAPLSRVLAESARSIEVRVANRDDIPGAIVDLSEGDAGTAHVAAGAVAWRGGLRFAGWIESLGDRAPPKVAAFIDDELVAEAPAPSWRHTDAPRAGPQRGFDLHLPRRYADGQAWRVHFRSDAGRELAGSPVAFFAFPEGLETALSRFAATPGQRLQAELVDRLFPNSLPFSAYPALKPSFVPEPQPESPALWGVVILDGNGLQETLDSLVAQTHADWTCAVLGSPADPFAYEPEALAGFVEGHATEAGWFLFTLAGVRLDEAALARFGAAAEERASLIYCDREIEGGDGTVWPLALPAFDDERMLEQAYFAPVFALPRRAVLAAARSGIGDIFRLANSPFDAGNAGRSALHLPGPAARHRERLLAGGEARFRQATRAHLAARGVSAAVVVEANDGEPFCRVRRRSAQPRSVTVVVPTRDRVDRLSRCLEALAPAAARARAEILVVDNESREPATLDVLRGLARRGVRVVRAGGPFRFARLCNAGAAEVQTELLCFLNPGLVALDDDWLEDMVSRHVDERVGVAGAKLIGPGGVIDHAGMVLNVNFAPAGAFRDRLDGDPGYGGALRAAHRTGAVASDCMTTRRDCFLAAGGFDEVRYPAHLGHVDYCLKISASGLSVVFTPHAALRRPDGTVNLRDQGSGAAFQRELSSLRNTWGEALVDDPGYSPLLASSDPPYSALAWPPRDLAPRLRRSPVERRPPKGL